MDRDERDRHGHVRSQVQWFSDQNASERATSMQTDLDHPASPENAGRNSDRMMQLITGHWMAQIVRAVAHYSIADELAKGPATAADIAARQGANPDGMFRLLRACASAGLVAGDAKGRFSSTGLLDTLRGDAPGSLRNTALNRTGPGHWLPWGKFVEAVRTGERQTLSALGKEVWEYLASTPDEAAVFAKAMGESSALLAEDATRLIDTRAIRVAADIGGAAGALVHALMEANPDLEGILFDLPNIIPDGVAAAERRGLGKRFSAIGGDFFNGVPKADLYLLKYILHDWDDASCICILKNCAQAMHQGGRVAVIEQPLGEMNEPGSAPLMDLNMMVMLTGRERSVSQYRELFAASGLRLAKVTPTTGSLVIMEAVLDR